MTKLILVSTLAIALAAGTVAATGPDGKALAQTGYNLFREVLTGDEAKLPDAIRYMEEAREADSTYTPNLFNLARAYFFDAITFKRDESLAKAEKTFARVFELDPSRTDAMAFHGSILAQMSGGRDMAMFMRGADEMRKAIERTPEDVTVRIVLAFTAQSVPPQAHALMGVKNTLEDLQFVGNVFDHFSSEFAPHAALVMNALTGEAYLAAGAKEKAQASFERALKSPAPVEEGALAVRKRLETSIAERMNGGGTSLFQNSDLTGCHSCHLAAPDKLLSSR